jgi:hypothetical protein
LAEKNLLKIINNHNVKYVFIGLNWDHLSLKNILNKQIENRDGIELSKSILQLIDTLNYSGKKSYLIGPISIPEYEFSSIVSRDLQFGHKQDFLNYRETKNDFEYRFLKVFNFFKDRNYNKIIKPHEIQCKNGNCIFSIDYNSLFSDNSHLSKFGSLLMYDIFTEVFNRQ